MKSIFILLGSCFLLTSVSAQTKTACRTLDQLVKASVVAIGKIDSSEVAALYNSEKWMEALEEAAAAGDPTAQKYVFRCKDKVEKCMSYQMMGYPMLFQDIKAEAEGKPIDLKLVEYKELSVKKEGSVTHHKLQLSLTLNGMKRSMPFIVSEYKGCFYMFNNLEQYYLSKE